jgi:hypothetical protein
MDFGQLEQFNEQIAQYSQALGIDQANIESALNDQVTALKEKGQALIDSFLPSEIVTSLGGELSGVGIADVPSLIGNIASGIASGATKVANVAVDVGTNIGNRIVNGYQAVTDAFGGDTSISALAQASTRAPATSAPEAIELTNLSASDAVSSAIPGVEAGVAGAEIAGATVADTAVVASTEAVGVALDATGVLAPLGLLIQAGGIAAAGYGLVKGFEDLFSSHHTPSVGALMPDLSVPQFQST